MLPYILIESEMFGPGEDRKEVEKDLNWFLQALTQRNQNYLKQHPNTPLLYKSGVRYSRPAQFLGECEEVRALRTVLSSAQQRQPAVKRVLDLMQAVFGGERFCDIGVILKRGEIDCDGLACWRAAELRQAGIEADPVMTSRERMDGTTYHALDLWPEDSSGKRTFEDPSLLLGMGGAARARDRQQQIQFNQERCDDPEWRRLLGIVDDAPSVLSAPSAPRVDARTDFDNVVRSLVTVMGGGGGGGGKGGGGGGGKGGYDGGGYGNWPHAYDFNLDLNAPSFEMVELVPVMSTTTSDSATRALIQEALDKIKKLEARRT